VEAVLREDPAGTYAQMDFATRDRYRHVVEELAKRTRAPEAAVAHRVLDLARRVGPADPRRRHIGFYLIDRGRPDLEAALGFRLRPHERLQRWLIAHATGTYLGSIGLLTGSCVLGLVGYAWAAASPPAVLVVLGLLALLPASELAVRLVNYLVTTAMRPRVLPKLELKDGVPPACRTMVVMPTMLFSERGVRTLLDRLEIHYLANADPGVSFALLTDFADAPQPEMPEDEHLLNLARAGIRELNARHGEGGAGPFWIFHRARRWNPGQGKWMGWERKRGKLAEFNRLLRGASDTSFQVVDGSPTGLPQVKYVITLDADTQLPPGTAKRLIGALAHPLNQPRFDPRRARVVEGYAVLQPRVSISLTSAARSRFARIFANNPGLDPYTTAVSDVYQDLFGEGSFTGKGIYEVNAFEAAVGATFPENQILSHDLVEGCHARVGLATDIELFDEFPAGYPAYARRQHRWVRGDWQLLPWLFRTVPTAHGRRRNPLTVLGWWKVLDNLRRSLVPPALVGFLAAGWLLPAGSHWVWSLAALAVLAFPALVQVGSVLAAPVQSLGQGWYWRTTWGELWLTLAQVGLSVTFLAHQAFLMVDAVVRTLARLYVWHRNLLEWETAAATERRLGRQVRFFLSDMWFGPVAALALAALLGPAAVGAALPFLVLWLVSPAVAFWVSRTPAPADLPLTPAERQDLRRIARKTWSFFERFVGPEEHWLPPDNFQEQPRPEVARRISPTNEGLFLASALAAHDFGYLGLRDLATLVERNLDHWERLERHRGHFYNWYDTRTLKPLPPRYISTVDSGNLAASLLTLGQGLREATAGPLVDARELAGLADSARLVEEALTRVHPPGARFVSPALDRLEATVRHILARLQTPPQDLVAWDHLVRELETYAAALPDQVGQFQAAIRLEAGELSFRVERLLGHLHGLRQDLQVLMPWLALAVPATADGRGDAASLPLGHRSFEKSLGGEAAGRWRALWDALTKDLTPQGLSQLGESTQAEFAALRELLNGAVAAGPAPQHDPPGEASRLPGDGVVDWLQALEAAVHSGARSAAELCDHCRRLAERSEALALQMDFTLLYDPRRRLFSVGYNLDEGHLDRAYYDLLASESRLASFVAIGKGDAEHRHWFQLGRPLTQTAGTRALLSWGGTMFEYLMPLLFTRRYRDTLLDESCEAAVVRQIEYGRQQQVPWGISESAYGALSVSAHYHYQSFGVPGLGLKRGRAKDLVVSPYSTALALLVQPRAALENFRALGREGAEGVWGHYDAIDYTRDRLPEGERSLVVRCYMAHHQGMSLAALANCLLHQPLQRRFHALPLVRATELLLQERLPVAAPLVQPHGHEAAVPQVREAVRPMSRRLTTADTPAPRTHLLSNGQYSVLVTNAGTGSSSWQGTLLTRWRPDPTRDPWGQFVYLRDLSDGRVWSAGFQPVCRAPDWYEVIYAVDKATFRRRDGDIETHLEIAVSPENNAEVRQMTAINHGTRARGLELTSYAEIALAPLAADLAHPAFSKLFIQTEFLAGHNALLAMRRPRSADQEPLWLAHVLALERPGAGAPEYETDRARFLGRGRTPRAPAALEPGARLSQTTGPVLDPIVSLRRRLRLGPGQATWLAFSTALARTRDEAVALADQYHDPRGVLRALELAWAHSQVALRHLHLSPGEAHLFQRLASPLLYPDPQRRAPEGVLAANRQGQPGLWRYGISGDHPIVLARLTEAEHTGLVRELLLAHEFWRLKGLTVDLVLLNEHPASYLDAVHEQLQGLLAASPSHGRLNKPGGIFLLRGPQLPEEDRVLLQAAAALLLHGERGSLARQVEVAEPALRLPDQLRVVGRGVWGAEEARPRSTPRAPHLALRFGNGFGGFSPDGREYVIDLAPGRWTPAPWSNVIANPAFGFLVTESGSGYTWSENSRENKLTPWSNDPVADPPAEALYLRDEDTGELWSPTPLPLRDAAPYRVRHGQGYSRFEHQAGGISLELVLAVAPAEPVKFLRLRLRNDSGRPRRLSATCYAEWVLGVSREHTQLHVWTEVDEETGALLARNPYNLDFGHRVAFLHVVGRPRTLTGDRREFFGRNGGWERPAALTRVGLSGRTGAGLDPCGAVQTKLALAPRAEAEVIFLLGQADNLSEVRALVERYSRPEAVDNTLAETRAFWDELLGAVQVKTPDPALDLLVNRWLLYQVLSCRVWGRSALYQAGGAYGFRDQLQDVMVLVYSQPRLAREHLVRAAGRQYEAGDVQHWWHPPRGRGIRTRFADDYLWLPFVTCHYVETTGDHGILDEPVPYLRAPPLEPDEEERYELPEVSARSGPLYEHCLRALEHGFRFGPHGLPLMGCGDWNDGLNKVGVQGKGESVWVGWFLLAILERFTPLMEAHGDAERTAFYRARAEELRRAIEEHAWDGDWYRRAYFDDGTPLGSAQNDECQIDSLAQSWAVLAGGDPERARRAMRAVEERLIRRDDRLVLLFTPPFDRSPLNPGYVKGYLPGVRENGGQYTHAALWVVQAFARLGEGDRAMALWNLLNPIHHGDTKRAEAVYKVEPYVVAADLYSRPPHTGRGGWTWYTGSAAWMYRVALEALLGFRLAGDRLRLDPCIPADWPGFEVTYRRGQTTTHVVVENPDKVQCGVVGVVCDGQKLASGVIPLSDDGGTHEVRVRLGPAMVQPRVSGTRP
jgi:cyclic beta-1,2-glucan synthetase